MTKDDLKVIFESLKNRDLTESQRTYIESVLKYYKRYKRISERQLNILLEMNLSSKIKTPRSIWNHKQK
jgi:hypothetical protein